MSEIAVIGDNLPPEPIEAVQSVAPVGDLLYGVPAIAEFLGVRVRQARHLCESGRLPTFKLGSQKICARRSTLWRWLAEQEANGAEEQPEE